MIATASSPPDAPWRDRIAIAASIGAIAIAAWLIPASVYITKWGAEGPSRVALFGSKSSLEWLLACGLGVAGGLLALTWRNRSRLSHVAASVGPFALLCLWTVPYLPRLPDRIPLLLVLAGPVRWVVAIVALAAALALPARVAEWFEHARLPGRAAAFAISLAVYLAFGAHQARTVGPGGDEPHYLMIAQSLLADHDLLIENNHQNREYRAFYGGELRPDYMAPGKDGRIYSIHAPGLAVLLLPAYAVAGYFGAMVTMCVIAALTALAIFDLARSMGGPGAALLAWLATCLTVPFLPSAWMIYPELPAGLIVAWAALWVWRPQPERIGLWFMRGVALAALPWLHSKFIVFTAIFGIALAYQGNRHLRSIVALAAPIAASAAGWLAYFYLLYGSANPEAPYGDYAQLHILLSNIPRGLAGLLFDQKFGLLFFSPIYLAAIAGSWAMLRRSDWRYLGFVLMVTIAAFAGSSARLYMWWGGSSPPARFLVPLIPCFAPMIAAAVTTARTVWSRTLLGIWLAISAGIVVAAALFPRYTLFFSDPHGRSRLLEAIQSSSPLAGSVPTFTIEGLRAPLVALIPWLAAASVAVIALVMAARFAARRSPLWLGVFASLVFLVTAGLTTATPDGDLRDDTARRGATELIWAWDPQRPAFDLTRLTRLDENRLRELSTIALRHPALQPIALPAGAYDARVWLVSPRARDGEIEIGTPQATFGRYTGMVQSPMVVPFELPASVDRLEVKVRDGLLAQQVTSVEMVPRAIVPIGARDTHRVLSIATIPGSTSGYIVYVDPATFPEGGVFWTRGSDPTTVLVAPGGASRIVLTVHMGPNAGEVRVGVAGHETTVRVGVNDHARLDVPAPRGLRLVPVDIQSSQQFRPSDLDPASKDTRRLGCQIRVELQ